MIEGGCQLRLALRTPLSGTRSCQAPNLYYSTNYIRYSISSNKVKFALPHFLFLLPPTVRAGSMKPIIDAFHARLLSRPLRNCSTFFKFDNHLGQRCLHNVAIRVGRISAGSKPYGERHVRWPAPACTRPHTSQANTGPGPSSSQNAKLKGRPVPAALHDPLRNRQPRIAAVKKEGTEDDPAYYQELTVPVSFPGAPGGGAGGPGGAGLFSITRSPLFDAALTTFIGLTMGSSEMAYIRVQSD